MAIETILVSAAISAIVGALVSIFAVAQLTVRRVRAERAEQATLAIRELVRELQLALLQFGAEIATNLRRDSSAHTQDAVLAGKILVAAEDLGSIRRISVSRRVRRLVGKAWFETAVISGGDANSVYEAATIAQVLAMKANPRTKRTHVDGLIQRALMGDAHTATFRRLQRDLKLLAKGW